MRTHTLSRHLRAIELLCDVLRLSSRAQAATRGPLQKEGASKKRQLTKTCAVCILSTIEVVDSPPQRTTGSMQAAAPPVGAALASMLLVPCHDSLAQRTSRQGTSVQSACNAMPVSMRTTPICAPGPRQSTQQITRRREIAQTHTFAGTGPSGALIGGAWTCGWWQCRGTYLIPCVRSGLLPPRGSTSCEPHGSESSCRRLVRRVMTRRPRDAVGRVPCARGVESQSKMNRFGNSKVPRNPA